MPQARTRSAQSHSDSPIRIPDKVFGLRRAHGPPSDSTPPLALADTGVQFKVELVRPEAGCESPEDRLIGAQFGNFRVMRRLCQGGMGIVYEVKHPTIERRAVVKVLHPEYAENEDYAARFLNEARVVNVIGHPGLVEVFDYGQLEDGTLFIVMEFLHGETLHERTAGRREPLPEAEVLQIAVQLAQALTAAHSKGVIHRDLKPHEVATDTDPQANDPQRCEVFAFPAFRSGV